MVMPAWVSKLTDLKAMKSKQKQSKAPFLSPSLVSGSKSLDTCASLHFAKSLSLQRANIKAHCARLEESLGYLSSSTDTDSIFSSSDTDAFMSMRQPVPSSSDAAEITGKLCSYEGDGLVKAAEVPSKGMDCKDSACIFPAMSGCDIKVGPHLHEGKKRTVPCAQNDQYDAIDNDTEGSNVLTPNTIESSFGSESSSANSSTLRKCGYGEDSRRRVMLWHEGDCSGSLERGIEASAYSKWQDRSSPEDLQSVCSVEMPDMSRLSYCDGALNSSKFVENTSGNLISVCSLDTEAVLRLTYNEELLNCQVKSSQNVAGDQSVSGFYECHTSTFCATRIVPGCEYSLWYEGSPSFANSSFGPVCTQMEETKTCAPINVSSVNSNMQQVTSGKCNKQECEVSIMEDIKVTPSFRKERSILEGTMLCSLTCSEWEEKSSLIAVENPDLMLSSKWHNSSCTLPNPIWESSTGAHQNSDSLMFIGQGNRSGMSMCVPQDSSIGLSMCVQQGDSNGLSLCFRQDSGNAGFHKSIHDAYLRGGRRRRGSSFSAVLPKDLQGVVGDSIALVKMSYNPYEDFRLSMYEMIMEKDLEGSMDVEELLYCYLSLNSPEHHELIEEVFSDVWSSILMSVR